MEKQADGPGPADREVPPEQPGESSKPGAPEPAAPERDAPAPERARRPVPGVKHEPEPDAENIMPAEDEPGTL